MKAGLGRRRFAFGGVTLVVALWAGAPWIFCSETWAVEAEHPLHGRVEPGFRRRQAALVARIRAPARPLRRLIAFSAGTAGPASGPGADPARRETPYAEHHALVAGRGLVAVGPEQPVPPRQVEAEVAVRFAPLDRVVHAVHLGRDDQPAQHAHRAGAAVRTLRVVEHRGCVQQHLEDEHADGMRAERDDHRELDGERQHDLERMEAHARRHVELEVRMVHAVQPPEPRGTGERRTCWA